MKKYYVCLFYSNAYSFINITHILTQLTKQSIQEFEQLQPINKLVSRLHQVEHRGKRVDCIKITINNFAQVKSSNINPNL